LTVASGLDPSHLSHDPAAVRAYRDDPLVHDRVSARLVRSILDAGAIVRERAAAWTLPTLLMWAGADRIVAPGGSAGFAARAPAGVVESHRFDGAFHELFNEREPDRSRALDLLGGWLARRFPPI
jgi:alpha-beta hydrolase superfamily lysophospholipase